MSNHCQNGAECITGEGDNNYRCQCPIQNGEPTYYGKYCEHDVNECHIRRPCKVKVTGFCFEKLAFLDIFGFEVIESLTVAFEEC